MSDATPAPSQPDCKMELLGMLPPPAPPPPEGSFRFEVGAVARPHRDEVEVVPSISSFPWLPRGWTEPRSAKRPFPFQSGMAGARFAAGRVTAKGKATYDMGAAPLRWSFAGERAAKEKGARVYFSVR